MSQASLTLRITMIHGDKPSHGCAEYTGTLSQWAVCHEVSDATGFNLLTFSLIFVMK